MGCFDDSPNLFEKHEMLTNKLERNQDGWMGGTLAVGHFGLKLCLGPFLPPTLP